MSLLAHRSRLSRVFESESPAHIITEHPKTSIAGALLLILAVVGIASFLPDVMRYIKMTRM